MVNLFDPEVFDQGSMRVGYKWRGAKVGRQLKGVRIGATLYDLLSDNDRTFPYHLHHGTEEWMLVTDGTPTLRMTWGERVLRPGDLVCFKPGTEGAHQVFGPGTVLIFSANVPVDTAEYPDSGKVGVKPPGLVLQADATIDYWQGEEVAEEPA